MTIEKLWNLACNGKTEELKEYYEKDGEVNRRRSCFNHLSSLIIGALRNNFFSTAEYLKSVGEITLNSEEEEYKEYMTLILLLETNKHDFWHEETEKCHEIWENIGLYDRKVIAKLKFGNADIEFQIEYDVFTNSNGSTRREIKETNFFICLKEDGIWHSEDYYFGQFIK